MSNGKSNDPTAPAAQPGAAPVAPAPVQAALEDSIDVVFEWCGVYPEWTDKLEDLCHNRTPDWKPTAVAGAAPTPGQGSIDLAAMLTAKNEGRYLDEIDQKFLLSLADPTMGGLADAIHW